MTTSSANSTQTLWQQISPFVRRSAALAENAGIPVSKASHKAIDSLFHKHVVTSLFIWFITRSNTELVGTFTFMAFAWEGLARRIRETSSYPWLKNLTVCISPTKVNDPSPYARLANLLNVSHQGKELRKQMYKNEKEDLEATLNSTHENDGTRGLRELLSLAQQMKGGKDPGSKESQEVHLAAGTKADGSLKEQGAQAETSLEAKIKATEDKIQVLDTRIASLNSESTPPKNALTIQKICIIATCIYAAGKVPFIGGIARVTVAAFVGGMLGAEAYHRVTQDDETIGNGG